METIKKKINALKDDNEMKQEEIDRLQENVNRVRFYVQKRAAVFFHTGANIIICKCDLSFSAISRASLLTIFYWKIHVPQFNRKQKLH